MSSVLDSVLKESQFDSLGRLKTKTEEDVIEDEEAEVLQEEKKLSVLDRVLEESSFDSGGNLKESEPEAVEEEDDEEFKIGPRAQQFLDEIVDIPKQLAVTAATAPAGIPRAAIGLAELGEKAVFDPRGAVKDLIGIDFESIPNREQREKSIQKQQERGAKKLFGEEEGLKILERDKETKQSFKENAVKFYDFLKKSTADFLGQDVSDTVFKGLLEEGSPFFERHLENVLGVKPGALGPTTPGGRLIRGITNAVIQQKGLGVPTKIAVPAAAVGTTLEEAGAPEAVVKIGSLLAGAIGGFTGTKGAKPATTSQTIERLKSDSVGRKILKPNIMLLEDAQAVGVALPPSVVGDSAFIEATIGATQRGTLSKRKFTNSIKQVGEETEVAFQDVLNQTAESSFEGPEAVKETLRGAPRVRSEAALKARNDFIQRRAKTLEAEGVEASKALERAQREVDNIDARMASNEIVFENPTQSMEKVISDAPIRTKTQMGESIQGHLDKSVKLQKKIDKAAYQKAKDIEPPVQILATELLDVVQEVLDTIDTPGPKSTAQAKTIKAFKAIEKAISDGEGTLQGVSPNTLINMKINLNDLANYDVIGSSVKFIERGAATVVNELERLKTQFPDWWNTFQEAERGFEKGAEVLRNDTIKNARLGKPETISTSAQIPSAYLQIEEALALAEGGGGLSQELKRQVFRDVVGDEIIGAKNVKEVEGLLKAGKVESLFQISDIFNSVEKDVLANTQNLTKKLSAENLSLETTRKNVATDLLIAKKAKASLEKPEIPQKLNPLTIEMLNSKNGIKKLRAELNTSPQGKEIMKRLERFKVEEIVGESLFDQQGNLKLNKVVDAFEIRHNRELLRELMPESAFKNLQSITNIAAKLLEKTQQISSSGGFNFPGGFFLATLFKKGIVEAAGILGIKALAKSFGVKFITDPKNLELISKLGRETDKAKQIKLYKDLTTSAISMAEDFKEEGE